MERGGGRSFVARIAAKARGLAYALAPEAKGKRDLRIDLLRGFCVFVMTVDHVGGESSWLYVFTGGNRFFVSAAEGFVLLSGVAMGMVHAGVIHRLGVRAMFSKVVGRARFLYVLTVALTLAFAGVSALLGTPWAAAATPANGKVAFAIEVITFHRSYSLTDVLVLYTLLVLAAAPVLWVMSRGGTLVVLALSFGAWTLAQISLDLVPRAWPIVDGGFPFAAWQLLFFIGLAVGYHRRRLERYLTPARLVAVGVAAVVALLVVNLIATHYVAGWTGVDARELLFDKNDARIGRVLALIGAASFLYAATTVAWTPIRRVTGWLLMPLGQNALWAYGVQLFVVAFWSSELMAPVRLDRENALFQGAAVLMVWSVTVLRPRIVVFVDAARAWRPQISRRMALAPLTLALTLFAVGCMPQGNVAGTNVAAPSATVVPTASWDPVETTESTEVVDPGPGRLEENTFYSAALKRTMSYLVYLPPGYDRSADRYPTLYMLHGGGGLITEWVDYGLVSAADEMMRSGDIESFVIVMPQGDQEYWVDHVTDAATGANGEKWGTYTARDVVATVDARYRTIADPSQRAIGGLSMGGHGALQLAMNFPGTWTIVGAHSASLRSESDAPTYFGSGAAFAARDPLSLIEAKPDVARSITWWIDAGDIDPWLVQSRAVAGELISLGADVTWMAFPGDHSATYWSAHVRDYLAFYDEAFVARAV